MDTKIKKQTYAEGLQELRKNLTDMLPENALKVFDGDAKELQANHPEVLRVLPGDIAPDFKLPNAVGETVSLSELLDKNRVVLTFYRGTWCPYCNLQLNQYQRALENFRSHGAELVAISPQTPDASLDMKGKNDLEFEVLSDKGNSIARKYTTVFRYGEVPVRVMGELGYDFDSFYHDDSKEIPVPAVFIIEQDGSVSFAKSVGGDYRNRVEASDIMNALRKDPAS